jgi:hypothetical protein
MSNRIAKRLIGFAGTAMLVGTLFLASAPAASAGGNCEPGDVGCNQTGGETCVDAVGKDPSTGEQHVHTVCADTVTNWDEETPTCEECAATMLPLPIKPTAQPLVHRHVRR